MKMMSTRTALNVIAVVLGVLTLAHVVFALSWALIAFGDIFARIFRVLFG